MRRSEEKAEEDRMLRDSARRFLSEKRAWNSERHGSSTDWQHYVEMGWPGMGLPETLEGMNADTDQCMMVMEEAGRVLLPDWIATDVAVIPHLARLHDNDELQRMLSKVPSGNSRNAIVAAENPATPLLCRKTGPQIEISGTSALVPGIASATHWIIVAEDEAGAPTVILTTPFDTTTCTVKAYRLVDGRQAGMVTFVDHALTQSGILATGDEAAAIAHELRDSSIAALIAECIGAIDAGFDLTVEYLKTRKQFGQTLSSLQAVQHLMAEAYCDRENLRSLSMTMIAAMNGAPDQRRRAVSAAKAYLGRNGLRAISRCIQVSGGIALTEEYFLGHVYKRLQTAASLFGNTETHISLLARASS